MTPEAKKRKNQKKRARQKQKKVSEKATDTVNQEEINPPVSDESPIVQAIESNNESTPESHIVETSETATDATSEKVSTIKSIDSVEVHAAPEREESYQTEAMGTIHAPDHHDSVAHELEDGNQEQLLVAEGHSEPEDKSALDKESENSVSKEQHLINDPLDEVITKNNEDAVNDQQFAHGTKTKEKPSLADNVGTQQQNTKEDLFGSYDDSSSFLDGTNEADSRGSPDVGIAKESDMIETIDSRPVQQHPEEDIFSFQSSNIEEKIFPDSADNDVKEDVTEHDKNLHERNALKSDEVKENLENGHDDLFGNHHDEHELMPWETAEKDENMQADLSNSKDASNTIDFGQSITEPPLTASTNALDAPTENPLTTGQSDLSGEKQNNVGKIDVASVDDLFGEQEGDVEDSAFWENQSDVAGPKEEAKSNEEPNQKQVKETKKFSFLEEDEDLLDEDSFLEAEDEDISKEQELQSGIESNAVPDIDTKQNTQEPSSKYAPPFAKPLQAVQSLPTTAVIETSLGTSVGIVPPQPFKNIVASPSIPTSSPYMAPTGISASNPIIAEGQSIEKLNDEKKKSDAYDFPMEIMAEKIKPVHAKPVGVPTLKVNIPSAPVSRKSSITSPQRSISFKNAPPLPQNPYANVSIKTEPSISIMSPQQSIVMPNQQLPHASKNIPSSYQPPQIPMGSKARTFSNVSSASTSNKAADGSGYAPLHNYSPSTSRNASVNKYAPSTQPSQPLHKQKMPYAIPPEQTFPLPIKTNETLPINTTTFEPAVPNIVSPTSLTPSAVRGSHARKTSSVYAPIQSSSKYAPTVHPQHMTQNFNEPQPLPSTDKYPPPTMAPVQSIPKTLKQVNLINTGAPPIPHGGYIVGKAYSSQVQSFKVDNEALLTRQFPVFSWTNSNKIVYGIPAHSNTYLNFHSTLESVNVIPYDTLIKCDSLLQSFPGPLSSKTKKKDVEKWLETTIKELKLDDFSTELIIWQLLKFKLTGSHTLKDIANLLYNSNVSALYLSQREKQVQTTPNAYRLDADGQMRILASLQVGDHEGAFALALRRQDYAMALLIGSLAGKEKWADVVQRYLNQEVGTLTAGSEAWANLLYLIFQVFIGNSRAAVEHFYTNRAESDWALANWKAIVSAVLININSDTPSSSSSQTMQIPSIVLEFLLEFGIFLSHRNEALASSVVFMIAGIPLSNLPVISNSDVLFENVGQVNTTKGSIWSELYHYCYCCANPKVQGPPVLLQEKLFHAFCLYEHGLPAAASKYTDYIGSKLKSSTKNSVNFINIMPALNGLTSRVAESNTGWLAKPKLNSVWGQLDKSFNKYIGGDVEDTKTSNEKKIFDGITPYSSNNSSVVDLVQPVFTPYQAQLNRRSYGQIDAALVNAPGQLNNQNSHASTGMVGDIGALLQPRNDQSFQGSPQRVPHANLRAGDVHTSQSRKVKKDSTLHLEQLGMKSEVSYVAPPMAKQNSTLQSGQSSKVLMNSTAPTEADSSSKQSNKVGESHVSATDLPREFSNAPGTPVMLPPPKTKKKARAARVITGGLSYAETTPLPYNNTSQVSIDNGSVVASTNIESTTLNLPANEMILPRTVEAPIQNEHIGSVLPKDIVQHMVESGENVEKEIVTEIQPDEHARFSPNERIVEPAYEPSPSLNTLAVDRPRQEENDEQGTREAKEAESIQAVETVTAVERVQPKEGTQIPEVNEIVGSSHFNEAVQGQLKEPVKIGDTLSPVDNLEEQDNQNDSDYVNEEDQPSVNNNYVAQRRPAGDTKVPLESPKAQLTNGEIDEQELVDSPADVPGLGLNIRSDKVLPPPVFTNPYAPPLLKNKTIASNGPSQRKAYLPTSYSQSTPNVVQDEPIVGDNVDMFAYGGYKSHSEEKQAAIEPPEWVEPPVSLSAHIGEAKQFEQENILPTEPSNIAGQSLMHPKPSTNKFAPIRASEVVTNETFEPVIKKSDSNFRSFTPVVTGVDSIEYNDVVEDESDDEDEGAATKKDATKSAKKKEEYEKPVDGDNKPGWFGWLKKETNEKKPVKAKLGNQNSFYYDEKLRRWVNKNATEEEKQKLAEAAAPPPPPVIKRKDTVPKTKPRASISHVQPSAVSPVAAVLPTNPLTGEPLMTTPSIVAEDKLAEKSAPAAPTPGQGPAITSQPGSAINNLSGKKTNDLNDLLNISGTRSVASRRKKKSGRGYVNVMENL
ncbi:hypothetical protein KAFR_0E00830 [Kazachstania africana CBS 2517]|uniref:Protein transport protein sec16 n=1 Tax=Kazachstania africana (strain ATCC 22294 / BCRC 22015 / CBS 2517 / CECT 1963 / NBRC 1671 / NRRL Y-8276) TaxID=1071382 RepID=H2AV37_KAZAF|nr:hypothetical protein KAFR_0E00830 [Kazachstania africana CBS 2517]CCF58237.1 hypothetical protein KAFR_0E00830 [Kazachstania africana CBS 2517]